MSPLREYRPVTERYSDLKVIEPYKKFYLVFEGQVTEIEYFEILKSKRKEVGIHNLVEIINMERTEKDVGSSNPKALFNLLRDKKKGLEDLDEFNLSDDSSFNCETNPHDESNSHDEFVMIFDVDIYKGEPDELSDFVISAESECSLFATSPSFELWLLLHKEDSLENIILPNEEDFFENKKISNNHRFAGKKLSEAFHGFNSKTRGGFEKFIESIDVAIAQEKCLQQDIRKMHQEVGSNIGTLIEKMKDDPRETRIKSEECRNQIQDLCK